MATRWHLIDDGREREPRREPEPPPPVPATAPGVDALLGLQATAGNQAVARRFQRASGALPHREKLEDAFGSDLSSIRADAGSPDATAALARERAHAAAMPDSVLFDRPDP